MARSPISNNELTVVFPALAPNPNLIVNRPQLVLQIGVGMGAAGIDQQELARSQKAGRTAAITCQLRDFLPGES